MKQTEVQYFIMHCFTSGDSQKTTGTCRMKLAVFFRCDLRNQTYSCPRSKVILIVIDGLMSCVHVRIHPWISWAIFYACCFERIPTVGCDPSVIPQLHAMMGTRELYFDLVYHPADDPVVKQL